MGFCQKGRDPEKGDVIAQIERKKFPGSFSILLYVINTYTKDGKLRIVVSDFMGGMFLLPPCKGHNFCEGKWRIIN